ncbi:MAG: N-acetylmuramoyl-L-alanine amidase [Akkermansiaceae bacterium]|jgi:N-acetylmuramoyl-L-alanine amidase|nr:N-acetylmuramoyl-L-alanine amidase [Luteolibacter sp.]
MRNPAPIIALLFLAALTLFLIFRKPPVPTPPPEEKLPSVHSVLGEKPDWTQLQVFQHTITRADFERLIRDIFTTDSTWQEYITILDEFAEILTNNDPNEPRFVLHFAKPEHSLPTPRHWKTAASLPARPAKKPLTNLHIAIDPGHIGGEWAKVEGRWFQIGEAKPVTEGDMTLQVAKLLKPQLEKLGAKVSLVRSKPEPVTRFRPENLTELAANDDALTDPISVQRFTEKLFYRNAEIRARADLVNNTLKPDLVLCLHFNADAWGDPKTPTLVLNNHFHILLNGAYTADEIRDEDQRFEMLKKLLQRTYEEELSVSQTVAETFVNNTGIPPFLYHPSAGNFRAIPSSPYLYARNLLANRLYDCPVIFMEPYVMNSVPDYNRIQAGDYLGLRDVDGKFVPSIFQEYAKSLAQGLAKHYGEKIE